MELIDNITQYSSLYNELIKKGDKIKKTHYNKLKHYHTTIREIIRYYKHNKSTLKLFKDLEVLRDKIIKEYKD